MYFEHATVKFNGGNGALLCSDCNVIIRTGFDHEDREHRCPDCEAKNNFVPIDDLPE